jgi:kynurenine 3-monooxygenase
LILQNSKENDLTTPFGTSTSSTKRSINLALSTRGMRALNEIGLLDSIMENSVRMPKRIIHNLDGSVVNQIYGGPNDALHSVSRQSLNLSLLNHISNTSNIEIHFDSTFVSVDKDGVVEILNKSKEKIRKVYDIIIGADGAYSIVREDLLKKSRINFSRQYIAHGYKELNIPPIASTHEKKDDGNNAANDDGSSCARYALPDIYGLHIWPRGSSMLIALPNNDGSFTATLFAPISGNSKTLRIKYEKLFLLLFVFIINILLSLLLFL